MSGKPAQILRLGARAKTGQVQLFPVDEIKVARENDVLYHPFGIENADDAELLTSVEKDGIREPLVLSSDGFLLSGHRRLAAAKYLGLDFVPARREHIAFATMTPPERMKILRAFNQQRDKTPGERIREQMLEIDPDEAYATIIRHRLKHHHARRSDSAVAMGERRSRARITTMQFLKAVQDVIEKHSEYWPLTDRAIHYLLLNDPPLRHDRKPSSRYVNDKKSYKTLCNLLIRARLEGLIPMEAIDDTTRPVQTGGGFSSLGEFVRQETEDFLIGYSRNLMQGQPHHVEIMVEKDALRRVLARVALEYCIPLTTGRGFSSLPPRYELFQRYQQSGKKRLVLLMFSDFDPDGEQIAASFARSMRDDFGLEDIDARKVALTAEDVKRHRLPSKLDAKVKSPNYRKFVAKYGTRAVELDAAPFHMLQQKLRDAIESVLDLGEFNAQVELEKQDALVVAAHRQAVIQALGTNK